MASLPITAMLFGLLKGRAFAVFFSKTMPSRAIERTFVLWFPPTFWEPIFQELKVAVGYPLS